MTAAPSTAVAEEAILCGGALRPIVAGQVACPHRGVPVRVEVCAECRLLTWRSDDRLQAADCSTESKQDR